MKLAIREGASNDTLPDPKNLPFEADEIDFIYDLWALWAATDKRYLPSQLIPELLSGHGRLLSGIMQMENYYAITKAQLKKQQPNE